MTNEDLQTAIEDVIARHRGSFADGSMAAWNTSEVASEILRVITANTPDPDAILRAITSKEMACITMKAIIDQRKPLRLHIDDVRAALTAVADALRPMLGTGGPRWRHKTRGTTYVEIGRATVQASTGTIDEDNIVVVYRSEDGRLWARERREFEDGRFEPVPPTQEPR